MKRPPRGFVMEDRPDLDEVDSDMLAQLAASKRCQQRLLTDGGRHYIFCGGYYHGKAKKTKQGYRCRFHD